MGPSVGIDAGDHIWCSRYILEVTRVEMLFQWIMIMKRDDHCNRTDSLKCMFLQLKSNNP